MRAAVRAVLPGDAEVFEVGSTAVPGARVEAYNALKRRWHGRDMGGYREAKARFIAETLGERG